MPTNEYRICPQCGNFSLTKERKHVCAWCGSKLVGGCRQCSKPILHPHGRFCYHCGNQYGFPKRHNRLDQPLVNTSETAIKVWVSQERYRLQSRFVYADPLVKRKV